MSAVSLTTLRAAALRHLAPLALAAGVLALTAPAAHAATITYAATDPATDGIGSKSYDIVSQSIVFDATAGSMVATVETAAPIEGQEGGLQTFLGRKVGEECTAPADTETVMGIIYSNLAGNEIGAWRLTQPEDAGGTPTFTRAGTKLTITIAADARLKGQTWDCFRTESIEQIPGSESVAVSDTIIGFVTTNAAPPTDGGGGGGGKPSPNDPTRPPIVVVTDQPDADKDGVPDTTDTCPAVPGAAKNGCATVLPAKEFRLGAKRVVVDRLVPRIAARCPSKVAVIVTSKGKRIGKGIFVVDQHGSFCRVNGIVALKVKGKTKVRVVAKGTGMASIARSVKR